MSDHPSAYSSPGVQAGVPGGQNHVAVDAQAVVAVNLGGEVGEALHVLVGRCHEVAPAAGAGLQAQVLKASPSRPITGAPVLFAMVGLGPGRAAIRVARPARHRAGGAGTTSPAQDNGWTTDGYAAPQPTPPKEGSQPSAPSPSGSAGSGRERAPHAPAAGLPAARHGSVAG